MPTLNENRKFHSDVMPNNASFLDDCVDWIRDNLSPEEVFTKQQLEEWAKENEFMKDVS